MGQAFPRPVPPVCRRWLRRRPKCRAPAWLPHARCARISSRVRACEHRPHGPEGSHNGLGSMVLLSRPRICPGLPKAGRSEHRRCGCKVSLSSTADIICVFDEGVEFARIARRYRAATDLKHTLSSASLQYNNHVMGSCETRFCDPVGY